MKRGSGVSLAGHVVADGEARVLEGSANTTSFTEVAYRRMLMPDRWWGMKHKTRSQTMSINSTTSAFHLSLTARVGYLSGHEGNLAEILRVGSTWLTLVIVAAMDSTGEYKRA